MLKSWTATVEVLDSWTWFFDWHVAAGIADAAADLDSVLAMVTLQLWMCVVIGGGDGNCRIMFAAEPVQVAAFQYGEDSDTANIALATRRVRR